MTSWIRKYCNSILHRVLFCVILAANITSGRSNSGVSVCSSPPVLSCSECLQRGPLCSWCFQEGFLDGAVGVRCGLAGTLAMRGCGPEFIEHPEVTVEVNAATGRTQVSPAEVTVTVRPGSEARVTVAVRQLERYPVDLYYLVDVSASMQENLDQLKTVGVALSHRMGEYSSDLRLGFGSFVDKPVSPYINVHPSKINNPCSDYEVKCRPAHGFHHVLSMTANMSEFTRVIKRQRISGNMDTPEGGLDAMLQATVCQDVVGWRREAKRLLLLMTDQPSHLALDGRLAGIVRPHDGLCHMENNVYTESTSMDHPSLGQLAEKLLENHIYSLFAVEQQQYQWYEELIRLIPGSNLLFQTPNLIDLVVDAYTVTHTPTQTDTHTHTHTHTSGIGMLLCGRRGGWVWHVNRSTQVYFNVAIGLRSCPDDGDEDDAVLVFVRPVGYNESTVVKVRSRCRCHCGPDRSCHDDTTEQQSKCQADAADRNHSHKDTLPSEGQLHCRPDGSGVDCSGRGECVCGRCVCERHSLGTTYGRYCEMDDYSCPYHQGKLCGGRGVCVHSECVCEDGWTGESCGCPVSTATCSLDNGLLCSGRGRCVCGKCECDDYRHSGTFCELCPTCLSSCQSHWMCIDCHLSHGLSQNAAWQCNHTCTPLVGYVSDVAGTVGPDFTT
uniref:Integrin beta n=1 Tax=Esox lucius TaxID=8010 RepID=A0A3P8XDH8_ESOLU